MKLFSSSSVSRTQGVCRNALKNFFSSSSKLLTEKLITERTKKISSRRPRTSQSKNTPNSSLYRRISPLGDPDISIVPVLDQWVSEGRKVDRESLTNIIKSLKKFRRFKHALEISEWMTDKRYIPPTTGDIASRLHLIYTIHGLQKAEEFYNNISRVFKVYEVNITLMNLYAREKLVNKTEAMMQQLRETGRPMTALPYNILSNLYYSIGDYQKMDEVSNEMQKNGIYVDKYSFAPRLRAYADTQDINGLNRIMTILESDPRVGMDCDAYIMAANAFSRVGFVEKSVFLLKKIEEMAHKEKSKYRILNDVVRIYAKLGKKDDVYRVWNVLKKGEVYNMGYKGMIGSLLKVGDILGAETVFNEWETKGLSYDFQVLDVLIDFYVKDGDLDKAEALLDRGIQKGGDPTFTTWRCLSSGFIEDGQVLKGVEMMKKAAFSYRVLPLKKPDQEKLKHFLELLEKKEDVEKFIRVLEDEGVLSSVVCERLLGFVESRNSKS